MRSARKQENLMVSPLFLKNDITIFLQRYLLSTFLSLLTLQIFYCQAFYFHLGKAKGALRTLLFIPVNSHSSVIIVQDLNCMFGVRDQSAFNLFSSGLRRNNEPNGFHRNLTLTNSGCFALSFSYEFTGGPLCVSPPVSSCHSSAAARWRKI